MINLNNAKIVFFGTSEFGAIVLTRLCAVNRPLLVITTPDEKTGRHQALTPSPVKNLALAEKIDFWQPEKLDENFTAELKKTSPDLFIVAAYGKIIPQFILDIPQFGALNIHPSLLPKYRGASPIQTALLNGAEQTGVSIILMDAKMDHGPIVAQTPPIKILAAEKFPELRDRLSIISADLLLKILPDWFNKKITPQPQNDELATFCHLIKKEAGEINWQKTAPEIFNSWRAFYPWPGIYSPEFLDLKNQNLIKLIDIKLTALTSDRAPGTLFTQTKKLFVACGQKTTLEIISLQPAGKKIMPASSFINGYLQT
ncbi:MAG TPA: methionyl-tRNA formyltransferase [bacterium]|nr:methionyl-tRNA formyltransferase [bacterium]HPL95765.1 methionyl-tRNA formyltransferase [bacterium]